ncbi:MAG: aromatic ring-hydroxylating dioxygenase subunit alpha [Sphingobium sp.]|uniref:aromatic ring-hydroxylating dioxygenase subunit alpha n=1 Tax=Sphingobium sp. TaxID=1912891 RepID=UPI002E23C158
MRFLENLWYAAGWGADVGRTPLARRIIDQPVVLYRKEDGGLVALADMCPHRFSPLSLGKVKGDDIECLYHGLRFDCSGKCVGNPHGPVIPAGAVVRQYPVAEYDGLVWVWMGDVALADESRITRFPMLNRPDHFTYTKGQTMEMPLNYELLTDNLMDLSHVAFTHADSLGSDGLVPGEIGVRHEGDAIWSDRIGRNGSAPACFWASRACAAEDRVDYWLDIRWTPPASFYLYCGITKPGAPREEGKELSSVQILTPASANQTYYFIKHFRDYEREDDEMTTVIAKAIVDAFATEDEPMIARVSENMAGRDFWKMKPVILPCDGAAVRVRRVREQMLREQERRTDDPIAEAAE